MWIHVTAYLALCLLLALSARALARASRPLGYTLAIASAVLMALFSVWLNDDPRWILLLPFQEVWLWSNVSGFGAAVLVGVASRLLPPILWQRALLITAISILGLYRSVGPLLAPLPLLGPSRWSGIVCRQTTNATCGPAAIASALAVVGFKSSEAEMTRQALTTSSGTSNLGIYRALRAALPSPTHPITLYQGLPQSLNEFPAVAAITVHGVPHNIFQPGGKHAIALLSRLPDGRLLIADPFSGLQALPPNQITQDWPGWAFVLH